MGSEAPHLFEDFPGPLDPKTMIQEAMLDLGRVRFQPADHMFALALYRGIWNQGSTVTT